MSWLDLSGATVVSRPVNQGNVPDGSENQAGAHGPLVGTPWSSTGGAVGGFQFFIDFGTIEAFDSFSLGVVVPPHATITVDLQIAGCESLGGGAGFYGRGIFPNQTSPWTDNYQGTATNDTDDPISADIAISVGPFLAGLRLHDVYDRFTNQTYGCLTEDSARHWIMVRVWGFPGSYTVNNLQVGTGMVPSGSGGISTAPETAASAVSSAGSDQPGPYMAGGLSAAFAGIISYNSAFYAVENSHGGTVYIYKTTDLTAGYGATWATVGGACPVSFSFPYLGGTPWFDGDHTITCAVMKDGTQVELCDFDLATEAWGIPYGTLTTPTMIGVYALYKRPDDSFLLLGEQDGSNVLPAAVYASGTWGTPFEVAANMLALPSCPAFPAINPPKSCMDDSGNIYVFWQLEGYTVLPDSSAAGAQSAWYGRAFYQRIASDNSVPSGTGDFYDFPGQDTVVDPGGTFPAAKDGDLAWNTTKRNITAGHSFTGHGGDCFGKPAIVGTSIFIPIRRKIPSTIPFVDPTTDEQLYTYATFYQGAGIPAPVWTELTTGCDPEPQATSTNKCDAVGNALSIANFLLMVYLYSNLNPVDPVDDNTADQSCARLCYCAVTSGVPDFNWIGFTMYDQQAAVAAFPNAELYRNVFDPIVSMVGTAPVMLASYTGGSCAPE